MSTSDTGQPHDGGWYEVRLEGRLDQRWASWFDGMTLREEPDATTSLRGYVVDQSALHGLLARLRDLGLPLLSVVRLDDEAPAEPGQQPTPRRTR